MAEPGAVKILRSPRPESETAFDEYRRQQLRLAKRQGLLPPAAASKLAPQEEDAEEERLAREREAQASAKPKPKIEFYRAGRKPAAAAASKAKPLDLS